MGYFRAVVDHYVCPWDYSIYDIIRAHYGKRCLCAKAYSLERLIGYIELDIQRKAFMQV